MGRAPGSDRTGQAVAEVDTLADLARLLRQLRRREARLRGGPELTYRELAAETGWSVGIIAQYFAGKVLPPMHRFDELTQLLGASRAEQGALATAWDRTEECRRSTRTDAGAADGYGTGTGSAGRVVPRQLPPAVRHFSGRTAELAALTHLARQSADADTAAVVVVDGTAGIGKTALAVHWAHGAAEQFGDGQLYVDLRGFDPTGPLVTPAEAVRGFLDALGVPAHRNPIGLSAQVGLYRSLLAGRRVLVVLDNARDADQVRPLLPGAAGCLAVVTSRRRLTGLVAAEHAQPLTLELLTVAEAEQFLADRLGPDRVAAEPAAAGEIVTRCARLPLALSIITARAGSHPRFPLSALAAELRDGDGGLDAFDCADPAADVRALFSWSADILGVGAAQLFRLLGLHPGPEATAAAAASLAGAPLHQVRPLLAELSRAHLVTEPAPGRIALHALLRAYALELGQDRDPPASRHATAGRLLDHYLHSAFTAALLLDPHQESTALPPPEPGVTLARLADHRTAIDWFTAERAVLLAVLRRTEAAGLDAKAWQLAWTLSTYLDCAGHWHDWATAQDIALRAARRLDDPSRQAHSHRQRARAASRLGRHDDACQHLRQALRLGEQLGDRTAQAHSHLSHTAVSEQQGHYREALRHAERALELYSAACQQPGQANALNAVGWCRALLGDYGLALTDCRQALALQDELDDRQGEAATWDSLGYVYSGLGHQRRAVDCYRRAVESYQDSGDRLREATSLHRLGDAHHGGGERRAAIAAWERAADILDELGHSSTGVIRGKLGALRSDP